MHALAEELGRVDARSLDIDWEAVKASVKRDSQERAEDSDSAERPDTDQDAPSEGEGKEEAE